MGVMSLITYKKVNTPQWEVFMARDSIHHWIEKAKSLTDGPAEMPNKNMRAPKTPHKTDGNVIMEIADKLRPWLGKIFENVRDENGMLVQPSRIRAIALNVAQDIVRKQKKA
jgi:hypothetical protein